MKKTLIAVAALSAMAASAMAANVTLYGKLDQGIQVQKTKLTGEESKTTFKGTSGISSGSRWGLKGTEEIADGYTVGFVLESGFDGMDGTGNNAFNRDAFLKLGTPFGSLTVGRTGMLSDGCTGDIIAGQSSPFGTSYGIAAATANTFGNILGGRTNRAVRYVSPKFAGVQLHAEYANMNGEGKQPNKQRYGGVGVSYANGPFYIAVAAETLRMSAEQEANFPQLKDPRFFSLSANYNFGVAKVFAGYQYAKHTPVSVSLGFDKANKTTTYENKSKFGDVAKQAFYGKYNAGTLGVSAPIGGGTLMASVAYRKGTNDVDDVDVTWTTGAIGYKYNLSKRTYLYTDVAYGKEKWELATGDKSGKVTQFNLGLCHNF